MTLTRSLIGLSFALLATNLSYAKQTNEQTVRHHHLPPHLTLKQSGVNEQKSLQPVNIEQSNLLIAQQSRTFANCVISASELANASDADKITTLAAATNFQCLSDAIWQADSNLYPALFNENSMIAIVNEAKQRALTYKVDNSNKLQNFILYLRVGFWAQWGNAEQIGQYTERLNQANHNFLDTFVANQYFYNSDEAHANIAKEAMILMSNFSSDRYLAVAERVIADYNKDSGYYRQAMMTQALTLLYRGSWNDNYRIAVESNPSILTTLDNFLSNNTDLIGHSQEYQYTDAVNELGRFLTYGGNTYDRAKPLVKKLLDRFSLTGYGASAWLKAATQVDYADKANCGYYGTCNFKQQLEQQVLPISHDCSSSLRIRAQQLSQAQLEQICSTLTLQESHFHQKLNTGLLPVADDLNTTLEMIIYDSSADYQTYSGILFGHSTNNGGIYLEGDPAKQGNIPRFLAYEAEWLRPAFKVWNLEHEYVHYLDGRFNMYGDFATGNAHNTVWWSEGLAEYISKQNKNDDAINQARNKTYDLSTLFRTDYNKSSAQIYDWGYLATRYMFEQQQAEVDNLVRQLRLGNYLNFDALLDSYSGNFDPSFASWLEHVKSTDEIDPIDPAPVEPPKPNGPMLNNGDTRILSASANQPQRFFIDLPQDSRELSITTSGGTGEADLYVKWASEPTKQDYDHRPWIVGNDESVTIATPASGRWHIMVNPDSNITGVSLKVSWTEPKLEDACSSKPAQDYGELTNAQTICVAPNTASFYIWVPANSKTLTITSNYGQGDASLLHKAVSWPNRSDYDASSEQANSNQELIVVNSPQAAWHHVVVTGQGQGMSLKASIK